MSHANPSTAAELSLVQLPMESTQWEEEVLSLCIWGLLGNDPVERLSELVTPLYPAK